KPFADKVPKRGLEPPLTLREPAPEAGACPLLFQGTFRGVSHELLVDVPLTTKTHDIYIVGTGYLRGQCWRHFGGKLAPERHASSGRRVLALPWWVSQFHQRKSPPTEGGLSVIRPVAAGVTAPR